ncbi:MAG: YdeI/OmpD-associated family protein [Sediminibacterium sp.]|nr:YdeI/OmpD-associated family protein [Sediminibacterium sp.]
MNAQEKGRFSLKYPFFFVTFALPFFHPKTHFRNVYTKCSGKAAVERRKKHPHSRLAFIDFALVFAINQNQLNSILKEVMPALHLESKFWVAYPKTTSKIVSDLNRDCSWDILCDNGYEAVSQIALDHVWTAMRFKKSEQIPARVAAKNADAKVEADSVDFEKRLVVPPAELEKMFTKYQNAREFFSKLSFTNQKEYVTWIEGAKKTETRQRRLEAAVEKLLAGKKNPAEK